jgi:hypothetical protein
VKRRKKRSVLPPLASMILLLLLLHLCVATGAGRRSCRRRLRWRLRARYSLRSASRSGCVPDVGPRRGRAVHVDSPRPRAERRLVPRWFQPLHLSIEKPVSNFPSFKCNLHRYSEGGGGGGGGVHGRVHYSYGQTVRGGVHGRVHYSYVQTVSRSQQLGGGAAATATGAAGRGGALQVESS